VLLITASCCEVMRTEQVDQETILFTDSTKIEEAYLINPPLSSTMMMTQTSMTWSWVLKRWV